MDARNASLRHLHIGVNRAPTDAVVRRQLGLPRLRAGMEEALVQIMEMTERKKSRNARKKQGNLIQLVRRNIWTGVLGSGNVETGQASEFKPAAHLHAEWWPNGEQSAREHSIALNEFGGAIGGASEMFGSGTDSSGALSRRSFDPNTAVGIE